MTTPPPKVWRWKIYDYHSDPTKLLGWASSHEEPRVVGQSVSRAETTWIGTLTTAKIYGGRQMTEGKSLILTSACGLRVCPAYIKWGANGDGEWHGTVQDVDQLKWRGTTAQATIRTAFQEAIQEMVDASNRG